MVDTAVHTQQPQARRQRRRRIIRIIDLTVWMTAGISSVVIAGLVVLYGIQFSRVLSPSMEPDMPVGSVAVTSHVPADQLRVGQVAILQAPGDNTPYIHRVVSLQFAPDGLRVRTKGDANPSEDPWTVTMADQQVAVLVFVLPTQRITDIAMRLQFIAIPLFFFGVLMTAYFGWNAMRRPEEGELVASAIVEDPQFKV